MGLFDAVLRIIGNAIAGEPQVSQDPEEIKQSYRAAYAYYQRRIDGWERPEYFLEIDVLRHIDERTDTWHHFEAKHHYRTLHPFGHFLRARGFNQIRAWIDLRWNLTLVWAIQNFDGKPRHQYFEVDTNLGGSTLIQIGSVNLPLYALHQCLSEFIIHPELDTGFDRRDANDGPTLVLPNGLGTPGPRRPADCGTFRLLDLPTDIIVLIVEALVDNGHFTYQPGRPSRHGQLFHHCLSSLSGSGFRAACSLAREIFDKAVTIRAGQSNHVARIDHARFSETLEANRRRGANMYICVCSRVPLEDGEVCMLYEVDPLHDDAPTTIISDNLVHYLCCLLQHQPRVSSIRILVVFRSHPLARNSPHFDLNLHREGILEEMRDLLVNLRGIDIKANANFRLDLELVLLRPTTCLPPDLHPPARLPEYHFLSASNQPGFEPHIFHEDDYVSLLELTTGRLAGASQQIKNLRTAFCWTKTGPTLCSLDDYKSMRAVVGYPGIDTIRARRQGSGDEWEFRYQRNQVQDLITDGRL